jgi:hydrogenase maturation protease
VEQQNSGSGIVVLGLGNPVLTDDAAGLHVIEALERLLAIEPIPGVVVEASMRAGFELIDLLHGYRQALIVDCLDIPDTVPGRVRQLTLESVAGIARLVNVHELSISSAFKLAQQMGIALPEQVEIYAIEAGDVHTISEELTPAVAAAIQPLAASIYARLKELAGEAGQGIGLDTSHRSFYDPRQ